MAKKSTYDASSISVLEGLEAVRKRPGMYIGSVSRKGLNHLIYEIVDNSVDEHLAGFCDRIEVTLEKDGSATIKDNGRGIPVGMHEKGMSLSDEITKINAPDIAISVKFLLFSFTLFFNEINPAIRNGRQTTPQATQYLAGSGYFQETG